MSWFGIVIERGPEGENWSAFCPDVGGVCCTTGNSLEEIKQNMKEALECYYADDLQSLLMVSMNSVEESNRKPE